MELAHGYLLVSFRFVFMNCGWSSFVHIVSCVVPTLTLLSAVSFDEHFSLVCVWVCASAHSFGFCMHHQLCNQRRQSQSAAAIWYMSMCVWERESVCLHSYAYHLLQMGTDSIRRNWYQIYAHCTWTKMRTCENKMESCYIYFVSIISVSLVVLFFFVVIVDRVHFLWVFISSLSRSHWKYIRIV